MVSGFRVQGFVKLGGLKGTCGQRRAKRRSWGFLQHNGQNGVGFYKLTFSVHLFKEFSMLAGT